MYNPSLTTGGALRQGPTCNPHTQAQSKWTFQKTGFVPQRLHFAVTLGGFWEVFGQDFGTFSGFFAGVGVLTLILTDFHRFWEDLGLHLDTCRHF